MIGPDGPPADGPLTTQATYRQATTSDEIAHAARAFGPVDLVVDMQLNTTFAELRGSWKRLGLEVVEGGYFAAVRLRPAGQAWDNQRRDPILQRWRNQLKPDDPALDVSSRHALDAELADPIVNLPHAVLVRKQGVDLALLRDDEISLVESREPGTTVGLLAELPAGELHSTRTIRSHGTTKTVYGLDTSMSYPPATLRHYTGSLVFRGRTLLTSGHTVLPDSFRFFHAPFPKHPALRDVAQGYGRLSTSLEPTDELSGTFFVLDAQWTGHFGHIMTETVPRLWGWDEARHRFPDLKALYMAKPDDDVDPVVSRLLTAYGIDPADQVVVHGPVKLSSAICASALVHNATPHFVRPELAGIWRRIGDALADPDAPVYERIFVARPHSGYVRTCRNAPDVEAVFVRHGFQLVRPDQLELAMQVGIFRGPRIVAGFAGSGMFNAMYTDKLEHLIVLAHDSYLARHENKFAAVHDADVDYFWSESDTKHGKHFDVNAFLSDWVFDFETNGAALEELLSNL